MGFARLGAEPVVDHIIVNLGQVRQVEFLGQVGHLVVMQISGQVFQGKRQRNLPV